MEMASLVTAAQVRSAGRDEIYLQRRIKPHERFDFLALVEIPARMHWTIEIGRSKAGVTINLGPAVAQGRGGNRTRIESAAEIDAYARRVAHGARDRTTPAPWRYSPRRFCSPLRRRKRDSSILTFPQRSPPWFLTTAACGSLRSTTDYRSRRALLHLSYSCILLCGLAIFVTHTTQQRHWLVIQRQRGAVALGQRCLRQKEPDLSAAREEYGPLYQSSNF